MGDGKTVLVIDDSAMVRQQVKLVLGKRDFTVKELANANDFLAETWRYAGIDLILLDITLPGIDGLAALKAIKNIEILADKPVVMLSGLADKNTVMRALLAGAEDYIVKPFAEEELVGRVEKAIKTDLRQDFQEKREELLRLVKDVLEKARNYKAVSVDQITEIAEECSRIVNSVETVRLFNRMYDTADYMGTHALDVGIISGMLGKWLGLEGDRLAELILAGLVHDIGNTQIAKELLDKPGELSAEEMNIVKTHARLGTELLAAHGFTESVLLGAGQHHERLDGSGYPNNLSGEEICQVARIIAIADVYDAMTSKKIYRREHTPFAAIEALFGEMFGKLDPYICTVFLEKIKTQLVGEVIRLADGTEAKVIYIDNQRMENTVMETADGELKVLTRSMID